MGDIETLPVTEEVEAAAVAQVLAAADPVASSRVAAAAGKRPAGDPARQIMQTSAKVTAAPNPDIKEDEMAASTDSFQDKTTQMMGDMGERAKGTFEKTSKMVEDAAAFTKENVEAIVESSRIAAKGLETLGQAAADYSRRSFESNSAALRSLSGVKSPAEFMQMQGDLMRQSFDAIVQHTSRSTEQMLKIAGDVAQPISNRIAVAADKMKAAA